jgi:hypothetical protein
MLALNYSLAQLNNYAAVCCYTLNSAGSSEDLVDGSVVGGYWHIPVKKDGLETR